MLGPRRFSLRSAIALSFVIYLASCGGDEALAPVPMPSPNQAPAFSSITTATVPENSIATIYNATATDPDTDPLTFSLAGGVDQALFRITAAGALTFATPPDFEAPADADRDNVYLVRIAVSDGQVSATLDLSVTVTNTGQDAFRVVRVGTGLSAPLFLTPFPDNSGRVFVVEKGGRIRILAPASGTFASPAFLDISGQISVSGERGLLGMAPAPDFATTGAFYVYLTNTAGNIEIRRYRTQTGNSGAADLATGDIILTIPHANFENHNGGWIGFGPDGFLYVGVGDGGGAGDPAGNAQNRNVLLGKMLRIDVSRDDFPMDALRDYGIPSGNPFAGGGGSPEIWALGLRNPFRNSFDTATGSLLIADVGQDAIEEVDLMRATDGGANFGWDVREGTRSFEGPAQAGFVLPVAEYEHGNGPRQGSSITGGYVYRGPVEALRGQYFFGDFVTGNVWSLPVSSFSIGTTIPSSSFILRNADFTPNAGTIDNVSSFGVDQVGNLYIVDFDGEIFRLEPN